MSVIPYFESESGLISQSNEAGNGSARLALEQQCLQVAGGTRLVISAV